MEPNKIDVTQMVLGKLEEMQNNLHTLKRCSTIIRRLEQHGIDGDFDYALDASESAKKEITDILIRDYKDKVAKIEKKVAEFGNLISKGEK